MDTILVLAVTLLYSFCGLQAYTVNTQLSPEGKLRNLRSTNDRQADKHHHHHHQHPMICCDSQTVITPEEEETSNKAFLECRDDIFMNKGAKSFDGNGSVCLMNCMMKKLNLMEDNGSMKKKALDIIVDHHNDVINNEARSKIVEICYDDKWGPLDKTWPAECNKEPYNLIGCTHQMKELLCPEDKQIENNPCDKYREELKKMYPV